MKRAGLFSLLLIFSSLFAIAQKIEFIEDNADPLFGKVLTTNTSLELKKNFFAGLQEKLSSNYQEAAKYFQVVLQIDPANHAALFELAKIQLEAENNLPKAEELIKKAIRFKSDNEWYWILLSEIYRKSNKIIQHITALDEILKLTLNQEEYLYAKSIAYLNLNEFDKALAIYDEMENKFGSSEDLNSMRLAILIQNNRYSEVEKVLNNQILAKPQDISNYIKLRDIHVKTGNPSKAMEILQKGKEQFPTNGMIRLAIADQFTQLKQVENAFIELKVAFADAKLNIDEKVRIVLSFFPKFSEMKARAYASELASIIVNIHPDEAKAFALYGDVLFQERKFEEARNSYRKALEINDQIYQIWEQLLRIQINIGDFEALIADGNKALAVFPNQAPLNLYTGIGYAQMRNHVKAISFLTTARDLEAGDNEILLQIYASLGDSYHAIKKFKDSDEAYNQVLLLDPNNYYVLNNYAYYLALRGERLADAEQMSKKSLELDPNNPSSEDTYAWILFRLKRYTEAKKWIEKSLQGKPENNATQLEHYGDILYHLGEEKLALEQWKNAKLQGGGLEKLNKKINEKRYID
jgi:tetratricopeptide (TPR) repeat protein